MATNVIRLNKDGQIEVDGVVFDIREFINKIDKKVNLFIQDNKPEEYGLLDFWYAPTDDILSVSKFINNELVFIEVTLAGKTLSASISGGTGGVSQDAINNLASSLSAQIESVRTEMRSAFKDTVNLPTMRPNHLLQGNITVNSEVIQTGFGIYTYTGNSTTLPSISLGMDIQSQHGDLVEETYGWIMEFKVRSAAGARCIMNSIIGTTKYLDIMSNVVEATNAALFTLNTVNGNTTLTLGAAVDFNTNGLTYELCVYQTTHKETGTTNHGKGFTSIYNPTFGVGCCIYDGSGALKHEIPTYLGRPVDMFWVRPRLTVNSFNAHFRDRKNALDGYWNGLFGYLTNGTPFQGSGATFTNDTVQLNTSSESNANGTSHVMYYFASSKVDGNGELIGNVEIGTYTSTGSYDIIFPVKAKPLKILVKCATGTTNWLTINSLTNGLSYYNINNIEAAGQLSNFFYFRNNEVSVRIGNNDTNAGGIDQYVFFIIYDNDNGSGKSKYKKSVDNAVINFNNTVSPVPFGLDIDKGILTKNVVINKTANNLILTPGTNHLYIDKNGNINATPLAPYYGYGNYSGGDVLDRETNTWYKNIAVFTDDFSSLTMKPIYSFEGAGALFQANGTLKFSDSGTTYSRVKLDLSTLGLVNGRKYRLNIVGTTTVNSLNVEYDEIFISYKLNGQNKDYGVFTYKTGIDTVYVSDASNSQGDVLINNIVIFGVNDQDEPNIKFGTPITESRYYVGYTAEADHNGQVIRVEKLPNNLYLRDVMIGGMFNLNQDYEVMLKYRRLGVPYKNETGKPIFVTVAVTSTAIGNYLQATVNGIPYCGFTGITYSASNQYYGVSFVVPPDGIYIVAASNGSVNSMVGWVEYK